RGLPQRQPSEHRTRVWRPRLSDYAGHLRTEPGILVGQPVQRSRAGAAVITRSPKLSPVGIRGGAAVQIASITASARPAASAYPPSTPSPRLPGVVISTILASRPSSRKNP